MTAMLGPSADDPSQALTTVRDGIVGAGSWRGAPTLAVLSAAFRSKPAQVGVALTLGVLTIALIGPYLARHAPTDFVGAPFAPPSDAPPLGADYLGRDVLTQVLYGGRSILWMAFTAVSLGVGAGVILGMVAGYSKGIVDDAIMRVLDLQIAFPGIVFVLLFVSMLGHHLWLIVLLVGASHVPGTARVMRGMTAEVTTHDYISASEALAVPRWRILLREILPNLMTPLCVEYSLRLTWAIAAIAAISFLGFGVQPPDSDWGLMINQNRGGLTVEPWAVVIPISFIAAFTVGTNLVGEGIARAVAGIDRQVSS